MKLAKSCLIAEIDAYARDVLGIPTVQLIERSGKAVARVVREMTPKGESVIIFAGKGNNGADGYAAACELLSDYSVLVFDVFGEGQKSEDGKFFLEKYLSLGGELRPLILDDRTKALIKSSATVVDAIFGTGFRGEIPEVVRKLSVVVSETVGVNKIAVDVPVGVNADDGSVDICTAEASATVELSFIKPGIVSYPARSFVGRIIHDDIGLPYNDIINKFPFKYNYIDASLAERFLPKREENSSKGSFGKLLLITGSERYRGAAALSLEAALRGGAGYVTYLGIKDLCDSLSARFPEAIYKEINKENNLSEQISDAVSLSSQSDVTLVGSGSGNTSELFELTMALLSSEGGTLVLDADAINALSEKRAQGLSAIKNAKRQVVLTPHPLEFARLSGMDVATVQRNRISSSVKFAAENKCILVLKGAGTIVTDGQEVYINSSGSSALAKAGSGDVLAGLLASLTASVKAPLTAAVLAVYFHGAAADTASDKLSSYGVTPSDLPRAVAQVMAECEKKRDKSK